MISGTPPRDNRLFHILLTCFSIYFDYEFMLPMARHSHLDPRMTMAESNSGFIHFFLIKSFCLQGCVLRMVAQMGMQR